MSEAFASKAGSVLILGATGDTGSLIVHEAIRRQLPILAAGRNAARLQELAASCGLSQDRTRITDLDRPAAIEQAVDGAAVIVNAISPALIHARSLAETAVHKGIAYVDISGDVGSTQRLIEELDAPACAAGATLVPAAAFSPFCGLVALRMALSRWPGADRAEIIYSTPGVKPSGGTLLSESSALLGPCLALQGDRLLDRDSLGRCRRDGAGGWLLTRPMLDPLFAARVPGLRDCTAELRMPAAQACVVGLASRAGRHLLRIGWLRVRIETKLQSSGRRSQSAPRDTHNTVEARVWRGSQWHSLRLSLPPVYPVTAIACAAVIEQLLQPGRPVGVVSPVDLFESALAAAEAAQMQVIG